MIPETPREDVLDVDRIVADIREKVRQRAQVVAAQRAAPPPAIKSSGGLAGQELLRRVHLTTARVEMQAESIGLPPPGPKTWRSRLSGSVMRPVAKLLWWYSHSIRESARLTNVRNREVNNLLQSLLDAQAETNEAIRLLQKKDDPTTKGRMS